jgi:SMODS and SLOG-associating 2TM effector domain 1/Protein of unknown function (DUF4231)
MDAAAVPDADYALKHAWDQQSVWSQTANRLKRSLFQTRLAALCLTIVVALFGALVRPATDLIAPGAGLVFAWLAAACAGILAIVLRRLATRDQVQAWARTRSVSEAVKAEVYTYLAGVAPYRGADRAMRLTEKLRAIEGSAKGVRREAISIRPASRELPPVRDVASYITERVRRQIDDYYVPKSREVKRRAYQFRTAEIGLATVAALVSATESVRLGHGMAAWLPVVTTITAVVTAEAAFQRYDTLALEYACTADQLENLLLDRGLGATADSEAGDDEFVHASELIISMQNQAWMARRIADDVGSARGAAPQESP